MDNQFLSPEERKALGMEEEEVVEEQPKQPVKRTRKKAAPVESQNKLVDEGATELEIARRQMLASFGTENEEVQALRPEDMVAPKEIQEFNIEDLLAGISIDVNKIEVVDKPNLDVVKDAGIVITGKPTFEAVCNQSGYTAYMESLKYSDLSALESSVGSFYSGRQRLYNTIYNRINTTSLGKMTYESFLKNTSLYDVPSLLYGIYCQTFRTETELTIICNSCEHEMKIKVPNKALICMKDEETYNQVNNIMCSFSNPQEAAMHSPVNTRVKVVCPVSKMVLELKIPTLYKYLDVIGSVKPEKFEEMQDILGMMVFIDKMYKLDLGALIKEQKVKYYEITDKKEIADLISKLELDDASLLQREMEKLTSKYAISYAIKGVNCRSCKKHMESIPINMEELTFFRIEQM